MQYFILRIKEIYPLLLHEGGEEWVFCSIISDMEQKKIPIIGTVIFIIIAIGVLILFYFAVYGEDRPPIRLNRPSATIRDTLAIHTISEPQIDKTSIRKGQENAIMKIVQYSDFLCPVCSEAALLIDEFLAAHPSDVQYIWKDFPVESSHAGTMAVHNAARCASEYGRFWDFHDAIFSSGYSRDRQGLLAIAQDLEIPSLAFSLCVDSGKYFGNIRQDFLEGQALGVDATPYYIIGDSNISGLPERAELEAILAAIKRQKEL